jgi:hypothetical protein
VLVVATAVAILVPIAAPVILDATTDRCAANQK